MDSELTITLIRLGYLALLWIMVLACVIVIKSDLYGKVFNKKTPKSAQEQYDNVANRSLVITEGSMVGMTIQLLPGNTVTIGRSPTCTIVINDTYASSLHAKVFNDGNKWIVEDLGSTNGTFLGEQKLKSPMILRLGDSIRIGQTVMELRK